MKNIIKDEMDGIYKSIPSEEIPWNIEAPPDALVEVVETGLLKPCKAVDLGCGAGNYAIYLAHKGFDVTGIDVSPAAIKIAVENSKKKNVKVNFLAADLLGDLSEVTETFDFAYD